MASNRSVAVVAHRLFLLPTGGLGASAGPDVKAVFPVTHYAATRISAFGKEQAPWLAKKSAQNLDKHCGALPLETVSWPRQWRAAYRVRVCSGVYGNSATVRARLMATPSRRWCLAHVPLWRCPMIFSRSSK